SQEAIRKDGLFAMSQKQKSPSPQPSPRVPTENILNTRAGRGSCPASWVSLCRFGKLEALTNPCRFGSDE
ncbi:TPA: hypothetical protein ACSP7Y_005163, partial [Serratia fonticola]